MKSGILICVFVAMTTMFALTAAKQRYRCRQGEEYFNTEKKMCVPCSQCTDNTHPHRQCYRDKDTLCLPWKFGSFEFKQSMEQTSEQVETPDQTQKYAEEAVPEGSQQTATTLLMADETSDDKWFIITMILAGILVIAGVAVTILLLLTCYMCKKKEREIIYESSFAGALLGDDRFDSSSTTPGKVQLFKIVTET